MLGELQVHAQSFDAVRMRQADPILFGRDRHGPEAASFGADALDVACCVGVMIRKVAGADDLGSHRAQTGVEFFRPPDSREGEDPVSGEPRRLRGRDKPRVENRLAQGTRRVYRIDPHGLGPLRRWLDEFWADALGAFADKADAEFEKNKQQEKQK